MRRLKTMGIAALLLVSVGKARAATPPVTNVRAREVTVLNDPKAFATPKIVSAREVVALNDPKAFAVASRVLAREVIALNDPKAFAAASNVLAREVIALNDPKAFASVLNVLAREVTVQTGPVAQPGQAKTALTLAGGLATATAGQKSTLNVVTVAPSASVIDILDAVRLARKAAGLDP